MNIIKPYSKIELPLTKEDGIQLLRYIELMGRVSHRSEDKQTEDSWERFITAVVLQKGDWSITEHVSLTVGTRTDRGITHELVRHRLGAYTQESTRFVKYEKKEGRQPLTFVYPRELDSPLEDIVLDEDWLETIEFIENKYAKLIAKGWTPQEARSILPNALASIIKITYNLRMWRLFFLMRTSKEAHPQMKQITIPLLAEFQSKIPLLYDDILPNQRQIDNLRKAR